MFNRKRAKTSFLVVAVSFYLLLASVMAQAATSLEVLDSYIAGWNSHDAATCASHFDKEIVFYDATVGKPVSGPANVRKEIVESFMTAVPDLKLERENEVLVQDDSVIWKWSFSGTNTGDWSDGTKATNKRFKINGLTWMKIKDGKIVYSGDFYDAYGFYQQLGLLE
ncbi:ester cyclase [Desulforhopalus singaporensis]|uniref:SnoaL-like domain-containing protein n=1 Tax=Desulforhopalus singaporensis TaxID=91360 RepID=A0A1H0PTG2_9BACT|nr:ester cyclase [Desulforhopalus singaporensis]SDP07955.1 conserved hypothetical protein, steroid delta-isomerase-related [Desulforhopalus singaporensis]